MNLDWKKTLFVFALFGSGLTPKVWGTTLACDEIFEEWNVREIVNTNDKRQLLTEALQKVPGSVNFHDLMMNESDEFWRSYRFFSFTKADQVEGFGGISPSNNFNIYSASTEGAQRLLSAMLSAHRELPKMILGSENILSAVEEFADLKSRDRVNWKYLVMRGPAAWAGSPVEGDYVFRQATVQDLNIVQDWYRAFNAELGESWPMPNELTIQAKRHFVMISKTEGQFLAGRTNTMNFAERLWVGRFYVRPEQRRTGMGTIMTQRLLVLARKEGKMVYLLVNGKNEKAIGLNQNFGFETVAVNAGVRFKDEQSKGYD